MPDTTEIQAIFFDIGDTLVFDDPPLRERVKSAAQASGLVVDATRFPAAFRHGEDYAVRRYVAGIVWDAPGALRETLNQVWSAMGLASPDNSHWADFTATFASTAFTRMVHPEAVRLLHELKQRGFTLGAISDWEETLPALLQELELSEYFDALAVSALVSATKPDIRLFQAALDQITVPAKHCLHIGDWYELDVAGAKAAGMQTLLFDWPGRRPAADCMRVTKFSEMRDFLLALPEPI